MMTMNSVAVGLSDDDGQSIEIMVINGVRKCRHLSQWAMSNAVVSQ